MNKLRIPNGGMPLLGDDFEFLNSAQLEAFKGLIHEFVKPVNGYAILGGCESTVVGSTYTLLPGYVMFNWEVCYFPGGSITIDPLEFAGFDIDVSYLPAGLKTFANSTTQNTYELRRVKLVSQPTTLVSYSGPKLSDLVYSSMQSKISSSTNIAVFNAWTKSPTNVPTLRKGLHLCSFAGDFNIGAITTGPGFTKFALLPNGFRPIQPFQCLVAAQGSGVWGNIMLSFFTNGEVWAIQTDSNSYSFVSINETFAI